MLCAKLALCSSLAQKPRAEFGQPISEEGCYLSQDTCKVLVFENHFIVVKQNVCNVLFPYDPTET